MRPALLAAALAGATVLAQPAFAVGGEDTKGDAQASTLDLNYELYVGGITLGQVAMSSRLEGNDYKAISKLETKGIVNAFWQAKIETSASGQIVNGVLVKPSLYDSFSLNRTDKRQHATLTFGPDGPKSLFAEPSYPDNRYPVGPDLQKNTLDPLSAGVFLLNSYAATQDKPCNVTAPIFDGRRRYDVVFNYLKQADVRMDNGLYSGKAMVCQVKYKQIAGYDQTVIEKNKKFPSIFAWVVPMQSKVDPSHHYMLPLRVWAETAYGIVVAVASQVKLDGAALGQPG